MRLNTLGGIRVVSDGNVVSGAAAQPRRLAVLALLARAGRAGVTREKIIALLWPDEPDDRARRTLNQAVYSLRRDLGNDDTLQGSKDLRLNLDLIQVDTVEFQEALDAGNLERAVDLYTGPFLDGFFLSKAPDFERWIESERSSLAREYSVALERVASRATERGDTAGAVIHWRKLAATDPLNARVALSVMRALIAAGDANGAIQHARLHEALLDQELGLPPDRDVAALARQLRERPESVVPQPHPQVVAEPSVTPNEIDSSVGVAASEAPAATVSPEPAIASRPRGKRSWLMIGVIAAAAIAVAIASVAMLRNRLSTSGDPSGRPIVAVGTINDYASSDSSGIARALRDMLSTNLARSPELRVVSGSRLLELERQMSGGSRVAGAIVPVARQAGATTLIEGALFPLAKDTLRLDLRVINLKDGNVLQPFTVSGHDPFALADSATARLVAYLGSTVPRGSVADATTRSVTAYRLYEEGLRAFYLGDIGASKRLFDAALQDDSAFAMAAYYAARATQTSRPAYLTAMRRAVALAARASDHDRLIIEGSWAETNNSPSLRAIAETLATRFPSEVEGHYYLGRALMNAGLFTQAIVPLHRVELMDSLSLRGGDPRCVACDALIQQAVSYWLADSAAAAERVLRRWIAARPNTWLAHIELGRTLSTVGRSDEALAEYRKAQVIDSTRSLSEPLASLWIRTGQFARADSLLRQEIAKGGPQTEPHWFLAISLRNQGRIAESLGDARAYRRGYTGVERAGPDAAEPWSLMEAQVYRELGRYRESAALFDSVARFKVIGAEPSAVASSRVWSLTHRAGALVAGGDTSGIAALADTVEATGAMSNLARDQRLHHHVRGLLFAARGNDSAAVAEFRRAIWSTAYGYTRTNLEMAKSLLRLGRYAEAIAILEPALRGSLEASNLYVTHSEIRLLLADAYASEGQRDRALAERAWVERAWANADAPVRARLTAK